MLSFSYLTLGFAVICLIHCSIALVATCPRSVTTPLRNLTKWFYLLWLIQLTLSLMFLCEFSQRCKNTGGIICCLWPPNLPSMPQCQRPSWRTTSLNLVLLRSGRVNGTAKASCQDLHLRLFYFPSCLKGEFGQNVWFCHYYISCSVIILTSVLGIHVVRVHQCFIYILLLYFMNSFNLFILYKFYYELLSLSFVHF